MLTPTGLPSPQSQRTPYYLVPRCTFSLARYGALVMGAYFRGDSLCGDEVRVRSNVAPALTPADSMNSASLS